MKSHFFKTIIAAILIGLLVNSTSAQNFLFQGLPKDKPQFELRFMRPNFEGDVDLSTFSGIYDLHLKVPISPKMNLVSSLPLTTVDLDDEDSETGIGDIYIGIQTRHKSTSENRSVTSLGVFLPTTPDDKYLVTFVSMLTHYYELHKYAPNTLTLYGNFAFYNIKSEGFLFGVEIGPNLCIPTKDEGDETELIVHYGIAGGYQTTNLTIMAELVGVAIITEDVDKASDRFVHSLAFGVQFTGISIRPGIFYKIYLKEDLRDIVDGVLGIKFEASVR